MFPVFIKLTGRRVLLAGGDGDAPALAGLLREGLAVEKDFIDLGEDHAFKPEIMDGECSA